MGDGLYSSQVDLANEVLVVSDQGDHVAVLATVRGDATLDRTCNGDDFVAVINNWKGTEQEWSTGDFTDDGICNGDDFVVVINNWKQSYTPVGGVVPEPATLSLLGFGVLGILSRRKRK